MAVKTYSLKKVADKQVSEHFKYREFACKNTDVLKLDSLLPAYLETIFKRVGATKAVVTSGYRTPSYSVSVGGMANDKHTYGMAADVIFYKHDKVISPEKVCCTCEDLGYIGGCARIGKYSVHIDTRPQAKKYFGDETMGNNSIWYYKKDCRSFYDWFNIKKPTVSFLNIKTVKKAAYRLSPFKLSDNKMGTVKKGVAVKVVKDFEVSFDNRKFYKVKIGSGYFYMNKVFLTK